MHVAAIVDDWMAANPVDMEPIYVDGVYSGVYLLKNAPVVPAEISVLAAEVLHGARAIHEHIHKAHRVSLALPSPWPPIDEGVTQHLAMMDNYAKHQALPICYHVITGAELHLFDHAGATLRVVKATSCLPAVQAGDPIVSFHGSELDEAVKLSPSSVLVGGKPQLVFGPPLLSEVLLEVTDVLTHYVKRAADMCEPLERWLAAQPERPREQRPYGVS